MSEARVNIAGFKLVDGPRYLKFSIYDSDCSWVDCIPFKWKTKHLLYISLSSLHNITNDLFASIFLTYIIVDRLSLGVLRNKIVILQNRFVN